MEKEDRHMWSWKHSKDAFRALCAAAIEAADYQELQRKVTRDPVKATCPECLALIAKEQLK